MMPNACCSCCISRNEEHRSGVGCAAWKPDAWRRVSHVHLWSHFRGWWRQRSHVRFHRLRRRWTHLTWRLRRLPRSRRSLVQYRLPGNGTTQYNKIPLTSWVGNLQWALYKTTVPNSTSYVFDVWSSSDRFDVHRPPNDRWRWAIASEGLAQGPYRVIVSEVGVRTHNSALQGERSNPMLLKLWSAARNGARVRRLSTKGDTREHISGMATKERERLIVIIGCFRNRKWTKMYTGMMRPTLFWKYIASPQFQFCSLIMQMAAFCQPCFWNERKYNRIWDDKGSLILRIHRLLPILFACFSISFVQNRKDANK